MKNIFFQETWKDFITKKTYEIFCAMHATYAINADFILKTFPKSLSNQRVVVSFWCYGAVLSFELEFN